MFGPTGSTQVKSISSPAHNHKCTFQVVQLTCLVRSGLDIAGAPGSYRTSNIWLSYLYASTGECMNPRQVRYPGVRLRLEEM